jgi:starch-binding outer membrane protein, SusD/RagB family
LDSNFFKLKIKLMKFNKIYLVLAIAFLAMASSCKKQLDVKNPNQLGFNDLTAEADILGIAQGGIYINGFNGPNGSALNWLGDSYFSLGLGYHSLLGDEVGAEAANQLINQVSLPDKVTYDNGTSTVNSAPSRNVIRINNSIFNKGNNAINYEWLSMYSMNNGANKVLKYIDQIKYTSDAADKKNVLKAWAYFWKGYAYSKIGSMYIAGIISNGVDAIKADNSNYISNAAMIAEANKNYDLAVSSINAVTSATVFAEYVGKLIPSFCQTGNGGILTKAMWQRNISTLKARNLLVNKSLSGIGGLPTMTAVDWNTILTLTNNGIQSSDFVFTGRAAASNGFFSAGTGSVQAMTAIASSTAGLKTFRLSERLYQDFKTGDARKANNFVGKVYQNQVGGFTFSTRFALKNAGNGGSTAVIANSAVGAQEIFIGGSYEENELMRAEANINIGGANLATGLAQIGNVRTFQGSGLAALPAATTVAQAKEELRLERRTALAFRGLAFYDARRIGYTYDVSKGGGRSGCVVYKSDGTLNTNAFMNYNFFDYWDVPDNEVYINVPAPGSAPVRNPN